MDASSIIGQTGLNLKEQPQSSIPKILFLMDSLFGVRYNSKPTTCFPRIWIERVRPK